MMVRINILHQLKKRDLNLTNYCKYFLTAVFFIFQKKKKKLHSTPETKIFTKNLAVINL